MGGMAAWWPSVVVLFLVQISQRDDGTHLVVPSVVVAVMVACE
jgi:hypothetical protein